MTVGWKDASNVLICVVNLHLLCVVLYHFCVCVIQLLFHVFIYCTNEVDKMSTSTVTNVAHML